MKTYIVKQPILDSNKDIYAYEVLWKDNLEQQSSNKDTLAANVIEDFFGEINSQGFTDGKRIFLTMTPNLIIKNIPKMFAPEKLVIQIDDSVLIHPLASKIIYRFKKQGYHLAVKGFEFAPRFFSTLDIIDYIKVDFSKTEDPSIKNIVELGKAMNLKVIAYNVNSPESYELAKSTGCSYVEGASVAQQVTAKTNRMNHMQSNFFQLMIAVTRDEPDMDEITEIISRDVTLTFSLIKLVNSAYFALRSRVKSVKQALVVLGLGQLKEWIYLLSFKDSDGIPEELLRMSFLRARFCSELAELIPNLPISRSEAYLMGMFSTLDTLMEVPLEEALAELDLSDEVKKALSTGEGVCGILYQLVLSYEHGDWNSLTNYAEELGLPVNMLSQKYFDSVENVNSIWRGLTSPNEDLTPEEGKEEQAEQGL